VKPDGPASNGPVANCSLIPAESQVAGGPFRSSTFKGQPCAGAAGGAPELHAKGISHQFASFYGAGQWWRRTHLDAAGAEGDLRAEYGPCCVVWVGDDPHPFGQGALLPLQGETNSHRAPRSNQETELSPGLAGDATQTRA